MACSVAELGNLKVYRSNLIPGTNDLGLQLATNVNASKKNKLINFPFPKSKDFMNFLVKRERKYHLNNLTFAAIFRWWDKCDQMLDYKRCPNVSKSFLNNIHNSFYINWCKKWHKSQQSFWATFVSEFFSKNFQKSRNLDTLVTFSTNLVQILQGVNISNNSTILCHNLL